MTGAAPPNIPSRSLSSYWSVSVADVTRMFRLSSVELPASAMAKTVLCTGSSSPRSKTSKSPPALIAPRVPHWGRLAVAGVSFGSVSASAALCSSRKNPPPSAAWSASTTMNAVSPSPSGAVVTDSAPLNVRFAPIQGEPTVWGGSPAGSVSVRYSTASPTPGEGFKVTV